MALRSIALALVLFAAPAWAQHDHIDIYSTEEGGGQLVLDWEFDKIITAFEGPCGGDLCLYLTPNPAFLSAEADDPERQLYALDEGTSVRVEITRDGTATLNVDGERLRNAEESAELGVTPFHQHPTWQVVAPKDSKPALLDIFYKATAPGSQYGESIEHHSSMTNVKSVAPVPCPQTPCPADCDDDGEPTGADLAEAVQLALDTASIAPCLQMDANGDGALGVEEIVAATVAAQDGCPEQLPASLAAIQESIFTPACTTPACHDSAGTSGALSLVAGVAHGELVSITPDIDAAEGAGLLRVASNDPERSFLYRKIIGPRPEFGSRMPLNGVCLPPEMIDQIRRWIASGALPE